MIETKRSQHWRMGCLATAAALLLLSAGARETRAMEVEVDDFNIGIEINATDGDAGVQTHLDAEPWSSVEVWDPNGGAILNVQAQGSLGDQGITEFSLESGEPLCSLQPLRDLLSLFPFGVYPLTGVTNDGHTLVGDAELTNALPAAPDISATDGRSFVENGSGIVEIRFARGTGLGGCDDEDLVDEGLILDPRDVEVDYWEVVVEVDEDQAEAAGLMPTVFTAQLQPGQRSVTVSDEFLKPYLEAGIRVFKFEVLAANGANRTASEGGFGVMRDDDDEENGDGDGGGGVDGEDITMTLNFPDKTDASAFETFTATVGSTVEFPSAFFGLISVDVSSNSVLIEFNGPVGLSSAVFNGLIITFEGPVGPATVNGATTLPGFDQTRLITDGNRLCINLQGLTGATIDVAVIDLN